MTVLADTTPPLRGLLAANLICMASMLIWAAGLPAADHLIPLLPHDQLNALRVGLAGLTLIPVWALMEGLRPLARVNWLKGIAVGSLIGLGAWLLIMGQARGGAVTAAVISSTLPVVGIALEVVLDGRKLTAALLIGLALSLIGGVLVLAGNFFSLEFVQGAFVLHIKPMSPSTTGSGLSLGLGALLCFGSVVTFALGSRLTVTAFPDQTAIGRTAVTLVGAGIAASVVALGQFTLGMAPAPDFHAWGWTELGALLL